MGPMSRRRFGALALGVAGAAATSGPSWPVRALGRQRLLVDGDRLNRRLGELARFSSAEEGTTRLAYSDEDRAARAWLSDIMAELGLEVRVDRAANLIGRRRGADPSLAPILLGSHIDSVPAGGSYDRRRLLHRALRGDSRTLVDAGRETRHPLDPRDLGQ